MYIFPEMLDMALQDNGLDDFPSDLHKIACENALICNPLVTRRDDLSELAKRIFEIPEEELKTMTYGDVWTRLFYDF